MYKEIFEQIKKYDNIVIVRHIGADPDALGSQIGLRDSIRKTFPKKKVLAVGATSTRFSYFPKLDKLEELDDALLIVTDTPDRRRVDYRNIDEFSYKIKIDHHPFIEKFCDIELIDSNASSASEIVLELINHTDLLMDDEIAKTLFLGIVSDSNRFLYSTSYKTHKLISELLKKYEFDTTPLYSNLYARPLSEIRLQGYIAQNMKVTKYGCASIILTDKILQEFKVDVGSAGNMVNNFNNIDEVIVWTTISEDVKNKLYKFNIRSRGPIINKIAEKYNGGGHQFASGARVKTMEEVEALIKDLEKACRDYQKDEVR